MKARTVRLQRATAAVAAAAALLALALAVAAGPAAAALPNPAQLVPGRSLAGVALGMTSREVTATLGSVHGTCRSCAWPTWYFQLRPFSPQGLGVELRDGRVAAVFTLWSPSGWTTQEGVKIGASEVRLGAVYRGLDLVECHDLSGYDLLVQRSPGATTGYLLVAGKVWGFMLARPKDPLCR